MEMQRYIGQTVGNWRLARLLGEGAFGAVFESEHVAIAGRLGAVKILRPELSMQRDIKQRFLNEASAASRAEHENIVQIFDGGITPDGSCYQVMELLKGQSLARLLQNEKRLDAGRAINISAQIAAALQAAHAIGIVHRVLELPSRTWAEAVRWGAKRLSGLGCVRIDSFRQLRASASALRLPALN
ncbi:MAG: protein kinase [Polyangia bacterium]